MARRTTSKRIRGRRGVVARIDAETGEVLELRAVVTYRGRQVIVNVPRNKDGSLPSEAAAEKLYFRLRQEIDEATIRGEVWVPPIARRALLLAREDRTFGELCDTYLDRRFPDTTTNGYQFTRDRLKVARRFFGDETPLSAITRDICANYAATQQKMASLKHIAPTTARHNVRVLQSLMNAAVDWEWLDRSPARGLPVARLPESLPRYLSAEEWDRLLAAADALAEYHEFGPLYLHLGVYSMLRPASLLSLTWDTVDMGRKEIRVSGEQTKNRRAQTIPLAPPLLDALSTARRSPDTDHVLHHLDRPLTKHVLRIWWERVREIAEVEAKLYDLRDTGASWLRQAGVSLDTIADLLGHTSTQVTKRYAGLDVEDLREAVERLGPRRRRRVVAARFEKPTRHT